MIHDLKRQGLSISAIALRTGLAATRARGRRRGRPSRLTLELRCQAKAMLPDTEGHPFVSDVIRSLSIRRTAFYHQLPEGRAERPTGKVQGVRGRRRGRGVRVAE